MFKLKKICLITILGLSFYQVAFAACENEMCEFDCKETCRRSWFGGNYVDNICYNGCLSQEHICKTISIPAAEASCRSMSYFQQSTIAVEESRARGIITTYENCKNSNSLASSLGAAIADSDLVGKIVKACGCFICHDVFSNQENTGNGKPKSFHDTLEELRKQFPETISR